MNAENLIRYIRDHLLGAMMALELIDYLRAREDGAPVSDGLERLKREIEADRQELERLRDQMEGSVRIVPDAVGWAAEKLARVKLAVTNREAALLEGIEILMLGISGKAALWRALREVRDASPAIAALDLERLEARAEEQRQQVERWRLDAARNAFR